MATSSPTSGSSDVSWTRGPKFLLGLACAWVLTAHLLVGPIFSPDSQSSVILADELLHHGSYAMPFVEATPRSLANGGQPNPPPWPPGMPALTAVVARLLPIGAWRVAQLLTMLAALASVLLTALLCRRLGGSPGTAALAALAFAASGATTALVPYVWSELLFVVPVLAALIVFVRSDHASTRDMLIIGLLTLAACLIRYAGVGLAVTVAACLVFSRQPWRLTFRSLLLTVGVPAAGVAAWLLRNKLVSGYFDDYRPHGDNPLLATLAQPPKTILMMLVGLHPHKAPLALVLLAALAVLLVVLVRQWPRVRPLGRGLTCVFAYCAIYTLWLCLARWRTNLSPIDYRYLWPMWPALIAGCAALAQRLLATTPTLRLTKAAIATVIAVILVGGLLTAREYHRVVAPQTQQELLAREATALSPQVQAMVRGRQVLVVDYWPDPLRQLTFHATRVWYMSPYAYSTVDFQLPGPWRDWLASIDVVLSPTPLSLDREDWSPRQVPGGATAYLRHQSSAHIP
ncbi:MAG: hypothetical protein ACYC63_16175 [Armatimonadota bacterium]